MAAKKTGVQLRAKERFGVGRRWIDAGELLDATDPIVKGREHLFEPFGVEQATAAPGEIRNVPTRPKRKKQADGDSP